MDECPICELTGGFHRHGSTEPPFAAPFDIMFFPPASHYDVEVPRELLKEKGWQNRDD